MLTLKEIAVMYKCEYHKISKIMKELGIASDKKGKGKRSLILPIEFELLKQKIGPPIK